jgi:uncharacterized protein YcfJ
MKTRWLLTSLAPLFLLPQWAQAQFSDHTSQGAALGGVAGALAGAAIGKNNHNTAAGALIGGAAGLVTGAALGSSADERERARAYQYQLQTQQAVEVRRAVSITDVLAMSRSGVGDDVIINQIRQNGVVRQIDSNDVITLHKEGVSGPVIAALQQGPVATRPVPVYAPPVVVEKYYVPPPYYYHRYCYPPPPPRPVDYHHGPGVHWGISVHGH